MNDNQALTILVSGGLDSYVAYYFATALKQFKKIQCLWFDIGQPYATKEWSAIQSYPFEVESVLLPLIDKRWGNVPTVEKQEIPGRNLWLVATAACMTRPDEIWLSAISGEMHGRISSRDKATEFFHLLSGLLTFTFKNFVPSMTVRTPFSRMTKVDVIGWAMRNGIEPGDLYKTATCYSEEHLKCGECLTCYKRWAGFLLNGLDEPGYSVNPEQTTEARESIVKSAQYVMDNDFSHYNRHRCRDNLEVAKICGGELWTATGAKQAYAIASDNGIMHWHWRVQ